MSGDEAGAPRKAGSDAQVMKKAAVSAVLAGSAGVLKQKNRELAIVQTVFLV